MREVISGTLLAATSVFFMSPQPLNEQQTIDLPPKMTTEQLIQKTDLYAKVQNIEKVADSLETELKEIENEQIVERPTEIADKW